MDKRIAEIQHHLEHEDYSLAVRRMLDSSLDSEDSVLLREVIEWSKAYRLYQKKKETLPDRFHAQAHSLLQKLTEIAGVAAPRQQALLSAAHISKTYSKGNFSLRPISLNISTGNIVGVVGQNGNGKTTLLRCLAGQLALDSGDLTYNRLLHPDHYTIKHHVAFIPQRIPRWYGMLKDNLHFSASLSGLKGKENELMVEFMLERLDLSHYAHLTWDQISSGYRTRFELARILLQKPDLLILDEPLANLDINAQQTILTDLRYMAKSVYNPMGIILSSQQLHEVEKVADTVLFIKEGECLFRTGEVTTTPDAYVLEIETVSERDTLVTILGKEAVDIHFNGGFYTITSTQFQTQTIIQKLIAADVPLTYFRDITYSTKRFF